MKNSAFQQDPKPCSHWSLAIHGYDPCRRHCLDRETNVAIIEGHFVTLKRPGQTILKRDERIKIATRPPASIETAISFFSTSVTPS